jgi:Mlc titration factor MtfA (ptsG expression regulator)
MLDEQHILDYFTLEIKETMEAFRARRETAEEVRVKLNACQAINPAEHFASAYSII